MTIVSPTASCEDTLSGGVETEAIAGEAEFGDVTASVRKQLRDTHRPRHHFVPTVGDLALGINFLVAGKAAAAPDLFERDERIKLSRSRDGRAGEPRPLERSGNAAGVELLEHRSLHPAWNARTMESDRDDRNPQWSFRDIA